MWTASVIIVALLVTNLEVEPSANPKADLVLKQLGWTANIALTRTESLHMLFQELTNNATRSAQRIHRIVYLLFPHFAQLQRGSPQEDAVNLHPPMTAVLAGQNSIGRHLSWVVLIQ